LSLVEEDRHKGALEKTREEFLFLSINDMITELSEYQLARDAAPAEAAAVIRRGGASERQDPVPPGERSGR